MRREKVEILIYEMTLWEIILECKLNWIHVAEPLVWPCRQSRFTAFPLKLSLFPLSDNEYSEPVWTDCQMNTSTWLCTVIIVLYYCIQPIIIKLVCWSAIYWKPQYIRDYRAQNYISTFLFPVCGGFYWGSAADGDGGEATQDHLCDRQQAGPELHNPPLQTQNVQWWNHKVIFVKAFMYNCQCANLSVPPTRHTAHF